MLMCQTTLRVRLLLVPLRRNLEDALPRMGSHQALHRRVARRPQGLAPVEMTPMTTKRKSEGVGHQARRTVRRSLPQVMRTDDLAFRLDRSLARTRLQLALRSETRPLRSGINLSLSSSIPPRVPPTLGVLKVNASAKASYETRVAGPEVVRVQPAKPSRRTRCTRVAGKIAKQNSTTSKHYGSM